MINIFDALNQVIHDDLKLSNNPVLTLNETQKNCSCKEVRISSLGKSFAFTLDIKGIEPFPFFKDTDGLKKRNDAIVICQKQNCVYIIIMELKSKNPYDGISQLKAGRNFINYVLESIKLMYKNIEPSISDFIFKYVIFTTNPNAINRPVNRRNKANYKSVSNIEVAIEKCNIQYQMDFFL